jgi:uncharacterized protein YcfL
MVRTGILIRPFLLTVSLIVCMFLSACGGNHGNPELTRNTTIELVDWHITGLWVINCPVAWVRVTNYNSVPIKDVTFKYYVYDENGVKKNEGDFTCEGVVMPNTKKNFIELYLGVTDLHSDRLMLKLVSVDEA